jgi:phosphoglycolate phosphatase-like HAD superfamily hydrolase
LRIFGGELELAVLDVDGVMVKLMEVMRDTLLGCASELGYPAGPIHDYLGCLGTDKWVPSLRGGLRAIWTDLGPAEIDHLAVRYRALERECRFPECGNSKSAIMQMHAMGLKLGICTANDDLSLAPRLRSLALDMSLFAAINRHGSAFEKPDPRALDDVFTSVGVPKEHGLYVGDWKNDWEMARACDVRFFAIASPHLPREYFLDLGMEDSHILDCLSELVPLIQP